MKKAIVIPSRLESRRFPNKPLFKLNGREMILHVCDRASETGLDVFVATPNDEILDLVEANGYRGVMTTECATGTDRVAQAMGLIDAEIIVNVQGDEPLVKCSDIMKLVEAKERNMDYVIGSMRRLVHDNEHVVKVFVGKDYRLSHMTRKGNSNYAQCGLYAFTRTELEQFSCLEIATKLQILTKYDNIELMRCNDLGMPVKMVEIEGSPAVDVLSDIVFVEHEMRLGGDVS